MLEALARFEAEGTRGSAVDLGCGTGRDTVELLRRGWRVLALDGQVEAIRRLEARSDLRAEWRSRLETLVSPFEEARWPDTDLVSSSFALPFCRPDAFPALWSRIVASLRPGGRFCGQLFGDRDGWSDEDGMTFLTRRSLDELLAGLDVERLDEVEEDGHTALGEDKHWHLYHLVVRKP
ncbi:MAG TPA: methyltransferase domain-containing protein [Gaiellaceae bacterium]|nr:methyltransferase domain-containing protein [Gaiellaceae bacterium]